MMNKTRMLGIINNLLLELQEGEFLDNNGVNEISRCLSENISKTKRGRE